VALRYNPQKNGKIFGDYFSNHRKGIDKKDMDFLPLWWYDNSITENIGG
jgi:hypothetical protein